MVKRLAISSGGQVSVPATVRKRWGTRAVLAEDMGDRLVLRPAPDDPIAAVRGIFAQEMSGGPTVDELREGGRREDIDSERRRRAAQR
ncbi:MAG TPA: AbrB/MazE/SpoVT family DNA-binding domain-containing protein [Solirubrobacteraceae bacterium]|nr:AbrB/MazE/SpoVT family DNA-binding domain-containing protein [Solirubrobacteraceae bacterium]